MGCADDWNSQWKGSVIDQTRPLNKLATCPSRRCACCHVCHRLTLSSSFVSICALFKNLLHVQDLNVAYNRLPELPASLCQLPNMSCLVASHNALQLLPADIGGLAACWRLDVSHNSLQRLPESLAQAPALCDLDVSCNQLAEVPDWIAQLTGAHSFATVSSSICSGLKPICRSTSFLLGFACRLSVGPGASRVVDARPCVGAGQHATQPSTCIRYSVRSA